MKRIMLLTMILLSGMLLQAQGIYNLWGTSGFGGTDGGGVLFKTDAAANNFMVMHQFKLNNPGGHPADNGQLSEYNGKFYGTGATGVIFEWDPATNIYTQKFEFINNIDGYYPTGSMAISNGKFYGMTAAGGINGFGVIFEWDPATNIYTKKFDFNGNNGKLPDGQSLILSGGNFYGVTRRGGNSDGGVIFEWNPITNVYSKKFDFPLSYEDPNGKSPLGNLAVKDGKLYGTTYDGGTHLGGVLFEWDPNTDTYTKKIDFDGTNGWPVEGNLTLSGGKFYGVGAGIFEWDPVTNVSLKKIDFAENIGTRPLGGLSGNGNKFYGVTERGGNNDQGTLFEWDRTTNVCVKKIDFNQDIGRRPTGTLVLKNGKFYGLTGAGGVADDGVIFEWDPSTNNYISKIYFNGNDVNGNYPAGSLVYNNGKLYGTTMLGGTNENGVLFEWDINSNQYTKKVDLSYQTFPDFPQGGWPNNISLTMNEGKFYGTSSLGGSNVNDFDGGGFIFGWDPVSNVYTKKFDFLGINGIKPTGDLIPYAGKLYGMTLAGGINGSGVIFEWDPATNLFIKKFDFGNINGSTPFGGLTLKDGRFYGMTYGGGINGGGVIFEWNPVTNFFVKKFDFDRNSNNPFGSLTLKDGKFYGMTSRGGSYDVGNIFEWDPLTNVYTVKINFNGLDGGGPSSSLLLSNGKFYGTAAHGINDHGVIFEWDPSTNVYIKKKDFNLFDGQGGTYTLSKVPAPVSNGLTNSCSNLPSITINSSNYNQWVPITDNEGNAVAEIKANGNNLGVVNTSMFINAGAVREDGTGRLYLDRTITITPQFAQHSPVDVRLYIKGTEFLAFKNAHNSFGQTAVISSINNIGIFQVDGNCSPVVTTVSHLRNTAGELWLDDYVLSTSINYFSTFCFAAKNPCAPPVITQLSATPNTLWPADHQMKNITVDYLAAGNCGPVTSALTVSSNEPVTGTGSGDLSPDWLILDDHHVQLRAESSAGGTGRIYTITVTSKNSVGTTCKKAVQVTVPYQLPGSLSKGFSPVNENDGDYFDYRILPNPSTQYFEMQVRSSSAEKIEVNLFDMSGRLIKKLNTTKDKTTRFGENLVPGMYMVKVIQGQHQKIITLVKQ